MLPMGQVGRNHPSPCDRRAARRFPTCGGRDDRGLRRLALRAKRTAEWEQSRSGRSALTVARLFSPVPRGNLPILPIAPAVVVLVGITTALVIAVLGISQLQATGDDAARLRVDALSATLAARLG